MHFNNTNPPGWDGKHMDGALFSMAINFDKFVLSNFILIDTETDIFLTFCLAN